MKVIDNFLPEYNFKQLHSIVMSSQFDWFYNDEVCTGDKLHQYTHTVYSGYNDRKSTYFPYFEYCLNSLRVRQLYRIKLNSRPASLFRRSSRYHIDFKDMKTAIFYMNTNNGYTKFKKDGKVKSVANRIVIFDSNSEHAGVTCTNKKRRVVVNINYRE